MCTEVSRITGMASLPKGPLSLAMGFLESTDVARAERVCASWRRVIRSEDQSIWKTLCSTQKIPVEIPVSTQQLAECTVLGSYSSPSGPFTSKILGCIAEYAYSPVDYRDHACALRANIRFNSWTWYIMRLLPPRFDWGDEREAFVGVELSYKKYWQGMDEEDLPKNVPSPVIDFPRDVPLRLLMDKEGNYKDTGDKIHVRFGEQRMILTCVQGFERSDSRVFTTFKTALEERVRVSCSVSYLNDRDIEHSKRLAKDASDWTVVQRKAKEE